MFDIASIIFWKKMLFNCPVFLLEIIFCKEMERLSDLFLFYISSSTLLFVSLSGNSQLPHMLT